jgi:two-component system chemotaxis response regulator CheY
MYERELMMGFNILLVDDSSVMRSMIKKTLKLSGIPIGVLLEGSNGKEGIELLHSNWIDLVITDINMPVMDGEEMLELMKQDPGLKDVPVLIVSTEGSESRIERLLQKGARFLRKPFTPEMLRDAIYNMLGVEGYGEGEDSL